jgi:exodeoxyribonuclease V gamma subunit
MSYHIYYSNNLNDFIDEYASLMIPGSLFDDPLLFVIQNKNLEQWVKLHLSDKLGISANIAFRYPGDAVRELIFQFENITPEQNKLPFYDELRIILYKTLESEIELKKSDSSLQQMKNFILFTRDKDSNRYREKDLVHNRKKDSDRNLNKGDDDFLLIRSNRLYKFSQILSYLFHQYSENFSQLIRAWDNNSLYFKEKSISEYEKWQYAIWKKIYNPDSPFSHINRLLDNIIKNNLKYIGKKYRIILFGSAFLSLTSIRFFQYISQYLDVHHFLLTPFALHKDAMQINNRLIQNWGNLALLQNNELHNTDIEITEKKHYIKKKKKSILKILQNHILGDKEKTEKLSSGVDSSIQFVSVTGKWREIEILKNYILYFLEGSKELRLTDIGVMAPDINEYGSYIETIFSKVYDGIYLPYNIVDLSLSKESIFIQGFFSLIELAESRFTRRDILKIFHNSSFQKKFHLDEDDLNLFVNAIEELKIKWGANSDQKEMLNLGNNSQCTWEYAFERLFLGFFLDDNNETIIYRLKDEKYLPFTISNSSKKERLGYIIHICRSLIADFYHIKSLRMELKEWTELMMILANSYLAIDSWNRSDRLTLNQFKTSLNRLAGLSENLNQYPDEDFDFFSFKNFLVENLKEIDTSRGQYLTGGITFSSIKPLRTIPFKILILLGMGEESYPGKDSSYNFDLVSQLNTSTMSSRRDWDKFSFLEALIAAEDKLLIFYEGRNPGSGEPLQPSILVNELKNYIDEWFEVDDKWFEAEELESSAGTEENEKKLTNHMTIPHPIQPFDYDYFKPDSEKYFSYNTNNLEACKKYYSPKEISSKKNTRINLEETEAEILEITISDLFQFIQNPVKYFFQSRLNIRIRHDELIEEDIIENHELSEWEKTDFFDRFLYEPTPIDDFIDLEILKSSLSSQSLSRNEVINLRNSAEILQASLAKEMPGEARILRNFAFSNFSIGHSQLESFSPLVIGFDDKTKFHITGNIKNIIQDNQNFYSLHYCGERDISVKHCLRDFIRYLIIENHPECKKLYDSYSIVLFSSNGKVKKLCLNHSELNTLEIITNLLSVFKMNLEDPVPARPAIAEAAVRKRKALMKKGITESERLLKFIIAECEKIYENLANQYGIEKHYRIIWDKNIPDFSSKGLHILAEHFYAPFFDIFSGKTKKK